MNHLLPSDSRLPVGTLTAVFNNTDKAYKFYWFQAILDCLGDPQQQSLHLTYTQLTTRMVASVWYPLNYYHLSFGHRDRFQQIADFVSGHMHVDPHAGSGNLFNQIREQLPQEALPELKTHLRVLREMVPYRFQQPFFKTELKEIKADHRKNPAIIELANRHFESKDTHVFYRYLPDGIELDPQWADYFQQHQGILRAFIRWHLVQFLQRFNPNVLGLSNKLDRPLQRDLKHARKFWNIALDRQPDLACIYTGQPLTGSWSLDHFIPWSYVTHDELWNLVPAPKPVNSSKGDCLPDLDRYARPMANLQHQAFHLVLEADKPKLLEDYSLLLRSDLSDIAAMPAETFCQQLEATFRTLHQQAGNLGFTPGWQIG